MKKLTDTGLILFGLAFTISLIGCSKSGSYGNGNNNPGGGYTANCSGINPVFSTDVLPLIQTKCAINSDCHGSGSTNSGGVFSNFTQISAKASNIKTQVTSGAMPKTGSITTAEKNTIICWINNGAPNN